MHFSLPVMLIIEVGSSRDTGWDFPSTLYPLGGDTAEPRALSTSPEYHLVGRLLYSSTGHFLCRYTHFSHPSRVYEYDGLIAKGLAKNLGDGSGNTLAGPDFVPPPGCRTHCVVYTLHGGEDAQKTISSHLITQITRAFPLQIVPTHGGAPSIVFRQTNTIPTSSQDRTWLQNPCRSDILDYHIVSSDCHDLATISVPSQEPVQAAALRPSTTTGDQLSTISCRCGSQGEVHLRDMDQPMVECTVCGDWSHVACQNDGSASALNSSESHEFQCDFCSSNTLRSIKSVLDNALRNVKSTSNPPYSQKSISRRLRFVQFEEAMVPY